MNKVHILKALNLISALLKVGDIDGEKRNKLLALIKANDEEELNKKLFNIKSYSIIPEMIEDYFRDTQKKEEQLYGEN